jgi:predicted Zn-dependent peptidase
MVVFCQGNIKPEKIFRLAEKEFGKILSIPTVNRRSTDSQVQRNNEATYRKHTHQVHAMLGGRAFKIGHKDQLGMFLLNNILGGGSLNSRLNLSLRETKGLVYTIESTYTPLSDTGYWCVYWACDPEDYNHTLSLVEHELDKLVNTPLTEAGLRHALSQLRGQLAISAQNQENSALAMAKSMLYHGYAPDWKQTFAKIEQTTINELQNIAKVAFSPQNRFILTYK